MSPQPLDPQLYAKVKAEADKKFLAPTSAYKSGWIVKTYKDRGGTYAPAPRKSKSTGLTRWFAEKWVDLNRPGQPCGRAKATTRGTYPLCRPSIKITPKTPKLPTELTPEQIRRANQEKQRVKQKKHIKY